MYFGKKKTPLDSDFSNWFEPYLRVFFRRWNVLSSHVMCPSAGDPEMRLIATVKASKLTFMLEYCLFKYIFCPRMLFKVNLCNFIIAVTTCGYIG